MTFTLNSINISEEKGVVKHEVPSIEVDALGLVGDAHAGEWHRQVSLLSSESVAAFDAKTGYGVTSGEFAENLLISGVDFKRIVKLDRFKINGVELEVTQIGKKCHGDNCAIFRAVGECVMPKEGVFARVLSGGRLTKGDEGEYIPYVYKFRVLTLSDRASRGVYPDLSGPELVRLIETFMGDRRYTIEREVIPDDAELLRQRLIAWAEEGVDAIFTTGGTGVGPRDFTPEVVREVAQKEIPGIMESIRVTFGASIPNALCSRSVAALREETLIYALPGSVKAVTEYFGEIKKTLHHLVEMVHGLGH